MLWSLLIALCALIDPPLCRGLAAPQRLVCVETNIAARDMGLPPEIVVTLAWSESRFERDRTSTRGAVGPLQVMPQYTCPGGRAYGCDFIRAGARALHLRYAETGSIERALCHYAAGNTCNPRARRYSRFIVRKARLLASGRPPWLPPR